MVSFFCCVILLSLVNNAFSFIQFVEPSPGAVLSSNEVVHITWVRAGDVSEILSLQDVKYDLYLCAGEDGGNDQEQLTLLVSQGGLANSSSVSVTIDPTFGGEYPNTYSLRMTFNTPDSPPVHSSHFALTDMTGTSHPTVLSGFALSSSPPNLIDKKQAAVTQLPYADQTGPVRYAPTPKLPGTKITVKSAGPLFPPSLVEIATTFLGSPDVETTVSAAVEMTATSMENTIAPAPHPTDGMGIF